MVYHGTPVNPPLPIDPATSVSNISLQSPPAIMEVKQLDATKSVANDYDVTEQFLNWQNNRASTEVLQHLNKQPVVLPSTSDILGNKNMYTPEASVDNAHCLPSYLHSLSEHFSEQVIVEENKTLPETIYETDYASDISSREKLDQDGHFCSDSDDALSHCDSHRPMHPAETPHRTRRDSEESDESMDTSSSLASSPYAYFIGSKFADTTSSINSAGNLIIESLSEDKNEQNLNDVKRIYAKDSCSASFDSDSEKATSVTTTKDPSVKVFASRLEPFSSHVEEADPEFIKNPPVVTDNLIIVEDESFLYHSQNSLNQSPFDEIPPASFLFRASTLPDLQAYQRHHDEYGICWDQDARIFLSEYMLSSSLCSLPNANSWIMKNSCEIECGSGRLNGQRPPTRQLVDIEGNPIKIVPSSDHTTVMVLLSLCVSILFVATDVIRNLQTSLHPKDGLGMTSLVLIFAGYTLGSLVSTAFMQHAQPRGCLIVSIIPNILFLVANLSSTLWLIAPISFLQGISMAVTWSVLSTYISYLASGRAASKEENIKAVCSRFFNYFSLMYQCLLLLGNLASSILLKYGNSMHSMNSSVFSSSASPEVTANDAAISPFPFLTNTFFSDNHSVPTGVNRSAAGFISDSLFGACGANYHNPGHVIDAGDPWLHPNDGTIYMLHGTFLGCTLVSLGIAVFGIEPLNTSPFTSSARQQSPHVKTLCATVKRSFKGMIYGCMALKFVLLLPLFMYSVMQFGFISAEVTVAFISCPLGIDQIGFSMAFFALGRFPTSFFCSFLKNKCGRLPLITLAASSPG